MVEKIGNVILDYSFYDGKDLYSDGDIEDEILEAVKNESDVNKIIENDDRWPVLYHLSPVRQNIISWYDFKPSSSCLEIGAGCGAITGALAKKNATVDCVDLSKRRCLINAYRNKEYDNVTIHVANFNDLKLNKQYDYITLIGVLEYAAYYTDSNNPFVDFLKHVKGMLKPDGFLLIAIENKYGLKYWNGKAEDHTGLYFEGISGYHKTSSKVRTFSKNKLDQLISEAGFSKRKFYYPVPDYKFPKQIYSEKFLPEQDAVLFDSCVYDNHSLRLFDENHVCKELIADGLFEVFANSFFVEVGI